MSITAHQVRQLRLCNCGCRGLGLPHEMLKTQQGTIHRTCAFRVLGGGGLTALPKTELGKLRLCDVPRKTMVALLKDT